MGQSHSRRSAAPSSSSPALETQVPDSTSAGPSSSRPRDTVVQSTSAESAATKRSRRSTFRRSFLGMVSPHSHSSSGSLRSEPSSQAESTQPPKKKWRSSRRWSKAPSHLQDLSEPVQESALRTGSVPIAGNADSSGKEDRMVEDSVPEALSEDGPRPIHNIGPWVDGTGSSTHVEEPPSNAVDARYPGEDDIEQDLHNFLASHTADTDSTPADDGTRFFDHVASTGVESPADAAVSEPEHISDPAPPPPPPPPRQFPPPGTLVVVQGVVNTTDAPPSSQQSGASSSRPSQPAPSRPPSAMNYAPPTYSSVRRSASVSTSRPGSRAEERHGARSRLSAFIPRPSSILGRRSLSETTPTTLTEPHSNSDTSSSSDFSANPSPDTVSPQDSPSTPLTEIEDSPRPENDGRPRPLSPSSIDVLGTLLSVAAAATAASLFSPGLAISSANGGTGNGGAPTHPFTGFNRPMSPTPTAGLANLAGLGGLAGLNLDSGAANAAQTNTMAHAPRDGRERIRNVWESVRDRLGFNPRNPVLSALNSAATGEQNIGAATAGGETRMRPGELMLAEMARALNAGLGLSGADGASAGARPAGQAGDEVPPISGEAAPWSAGMDAAAGSLPPDGSFERFLLNLQADLRAALSEDDSAARTERDTQPPAVAPTPVSHDGNGSGAESSVDPSVDIIPAATEDGDARPSSEDDVNDDEPPPLRDFSDDDSDTDYDEDEEDEEAFEDDAYSADFRHSARTPTPIPNGALPFVSDQRSALNVAGTRGGDRERRPPGINLWRLYRFQPIQANQAQGHAASTSSQAASNSGSDPVTAPSTSTPGDGSPAPTPSPTPDPLRDSSSAESDPASMPSSSTTETNANVVVPVIVVGLQSVDMGHTQEHAHGGQHTTTPSDDSRTEHGRSSSEDWQRANIAAPTEGGRTPTPRGRPWHSRAASAFRTLRPGRRGGSRGRSATESTGARTFLIYVIGGYYPPNHHMVTGSDSLDSYEALWELAELLGQVKPPVATREDIDKSGLQIIKSTDLEQYEKEGRVAANCIDRCLICLDDYDPEDDLRLMTCKHAFHKDCVDKWLQVGRNNCPACRTKGVSTAGDSSS